MVDGNEVDKSPYMCSMISEGGDGHGILMMEPHNIYMTTLAVSFAHARV